MSESDAKTKKRKLPAALVFMLFVFVILLLSIGIITMLRGNEPALKNTKEPTNESPKVSNETRLSSVIVVDAGHGGMDSGARGTVTGVHEDVLNLDVAKKLEKLLADNGAKVIMTRESEDAVASTKALDMEKRREVIKNSNADIVISIHMNFWSDTTSCGPQVFYYEGSKEGLALAQQIQEKMNDELAPPSPRTHMKGNYFILRSGDAPAVIVECGFLSNAKEEAMLQDEAYRGKIAQAVFDGIKSYVSPQEGAEIIKQ